jgi:hypothetical protein
MARFSFEQSARRALVLYAAGVEDGSYEDQMDEIAAHCTDNQWDRLCDSLDRADEWLAETDKGTPYQKEKIASRRENRPMKSELNPFMSVFSAPPTEHP